MAYEKASKDELIRKLKHKDERIEVLMLHVERLRESSQRNYTAYMTGIPPEDVAYTEIEKR